MNKFARISVLCLAFALVLAPAEALAAQAEPEASSMVSSETTTLATPLASTPEEQSTAEAVKATGAESKKQSSEDLWVWIWIGRPLDAFFQWGGWLAISAAAQLLLAIFAFFTIYHGMKKDKDYLTEKDIEFAFPSEDTSDGLQTRISIYNGGLSPIYIIRCGIQVEREGKDTLKIPIVLDTALQINVRETKHVSHTLTDEEKIKEFKNFIEQKGNVNQEVYVYVETAPGKVVYKKSGYSIGSLSAAYAQYRKEKEDPDKPRKKATVSGA